MNPLPLFLVIVSLPLLLGGCGEKESVGKVQPELEGVNFEELEVREGISYFKDTPYTGKSYLMYESGQKLMAINFKDGKEDGLSVGWYRNGQKTLEANYKDGKQDGLLVGWYENGQKSREVNYKNGKLVEGSAKYWNSKGEPVDIKEEALKE